MARRPRRRLCCCCCLLPLLLGIGLVAYIHHVRRAPHWPPKSVARIPHSDGCKRPDWSPDGKELVFDRWPNPRPGQEGVGCISVSDGKIRPIAAFGYGPTWSGDGKSIVFTDLLYVNGRAQPSPIPTHPVLCSAGGKVVYRFDERRMRMSQARIDRRTGCIYGVAASRAGLGSRWGDDVVIAIDPKADRMRIVTARTISQQGRAVIWSPDGKHSAYRQMMGGRMGYHHSVMVTDVDGTHPRALPGPASLLSPPSWSPDGKWIAVIAMRNSPGKRLTDLVDSSPMRERRLGNTLADGIIGAVGPGAYRGAELWVLAADGSSKQMVLDMGPTVDAYTAVTATNAPTWSPDGTRIAFVKNGAIWEWKR